jgi:ABC-type branched-subunit amino acid transport system substrate-binding protein
VVKHRPCLLGFDSYKIISNGLITNKYDFATIKNYLYNVKYSGVSGEICFDKNGDIVPNIEIMIIKDKKAVNYEKIK